MKPSKDLFNLIRSLNKNEKGYFRKNISDRNAARLFDAINAIGTEKNYNESALKEKLKLSNFPVLKQYLYESVLRSLSQYHTACSKYLILKDQLKAYHVLRSKDLNLQAEKLLAKAKKLAERSEDLYTLSEIILLELRTEINRLQYEDKEKKLKEILEESKTVLKKLDNLNEYNLLYSTVSSTALKYSQSSKDLREAQKKELITLLKSNKMLSDEKCAMSFPAKMLYFESHLVVYNSFSLYSDGYETCKSFVEFMHQNRTAALCYFRSYLTALNNLLIRCLTTNRIAEFNELLPEYRALSKKQSANAYLLSFNLEFTLLNKNGDVERALELVSELDRELSRLKDKFNEVVGLYLQMNAAVSYFIAGDFESALKKVNIIINATKIKDDIISQALLFKLVIHYELKDYKLLEHYTKSVYRHFKNKKQLSEKESALLSFLKQSVEKDDLSILFRELNMRLKKAPSNPDEDEFDYISWLESKIRNKPFLEIIREKNAKI